MVIRLSSAHVDYVVSDWSKVAAGREGKGRGGSSVSHNVFYTLFRLELEKIREKRHVSSGRVAAMETGARRGTQTTFVETLP